MNENAAVPHWTDSLLPTDALIGNPDAWWWIVTAMIAATLISLSVFARRRAQRRFATVDRLDDFFDRKSFFARHGVLAAFASAGLVGLSLILLTLGLMDIRWGKSEQEVPQKGIEMMFLLDVSRSMLAEDVAPNRLERAKQMIRDMTERMAGDRVGLIVFAGENRQTIPLTNHYDDFSQMLEEVSPASVRRGGSKLGDAIAAGGRAFLSKTSAHRVIVVLTDGEDQESEPVKLAMRLHDDEGIRVFTIGLGDMDEGARIPEVDLERPRQQSGRFVKYQGQPVWSKMNGEILREIATATDGVYIPAGTKQVDMGAVYDRYFAGIEATEFDTAKVDRYTARYQWFALPALVLLLIEFVSKLSLRKPMFAHGSRTSIVAGLFAVVVASQATMVLAQSTVSTPLQAYHQGIERYRQDDFDGAVELFSQAVGASHDELAAAARYNMATTLYAQAVRGLGGNQATPPSAASSPAKTDPEALLTQAVDAFQSALRLRPDWDDARANLEKTVRLLDQLKQQQKQQDQQQDQKSEEQDSKKSESDPQQSESEKSESKEAESEESESKPSEQDQSSESESESSQTGDDSEGQPNESSTENSMLDSAGESPSEPSSTQQSQPGNAGQDDPSSEEKAESDAEQLSSPTDASGELSSNNEGEPSAEPVSGNAVKESQMEDQSMTPEEAQKMLQAVRDRDMIRRYRLHQMQRSRQIQVDRDW